MANAVAKGKLGIKGQRQSTMTLSLGGFARLKATTIRFNGRALTISRKY